MRWFSRKRERFRFCWNTLGGDHHEGYVVEIDNGTLIVDCDDGETRAVRVDDYRLREGVYIGGRFHQTGTCEGAKV